MSGDSELERQEMASHQREREMDRMILENQSMMTFEHSDDFFPEQHQVTYTQSLIPQMKNLPFDASLPHITSHK